MSRDLILLTSTSSIEEAVMLQGFLVEEGIQAQVVNDGLTTGMYPMGSHTKPQVVIPSDTIERAQQIYSWFQDQRRSASSSSSCGSGGCGCSPKEKSDVFEGELTSEEEIDFDWPICPQCDKNRQAVCDICGHAGDSFHQAEFQGVAAPTGKVSASEKKGADAEPLLMCPNCDEAFPPRYYRICAWCDYDFHSGIDLPEPSTKQKEPFNQRIYTAVTILVLATAAAIGYFWFIGTLK